MRKFAAGFLIASGILAPAALAGSITVFDTGAPDGVIATVSRQASAGKLETETADDFVLAQDAMVTGATFIGLLPLGAQLNSIQNVEIELYHVFPLYSTSPPDGRVVTRANSPSDNQFAVFDAGAGDFIFTPSIVNASFTAANSVINGINPSPNQFTGGEGPVTGEEVFFTITFTNPFLVLSADHDFFRPEVQLSSGDFLWLSAPKPIVSGTPFIPDLQSWIRTDGAGALNPDWSRIGTDITHQGPFNASFSLQGVFVPEPSTLVLFGTGLLAVVWLRKRRPADR